jgi:hypothetical protein
MRCRRVPSAGAHHVGRGPTTGEQDIAFDAMAARQRAVAEVILPQPYVEQLVSFIESAQKYLAEHPISSVCPAPLPPGPETPRVRMTTGAIRGRFEPSLGDTTPRKSCGRLALMNGVREADVQHKAGSGPADMTWR